MPRITFTGPASVHDGIPPNVQTVTDIESLKAMHGFQSNDLLCVDYIDEELVEKLQLAGGRIRFYFDEPTQKLRVSTSYGVSSNPEKEDIQLLQNETENQWKEGIGGAAFFRINEHAPSLELARLIAQDDPGSLKDFDTNYICALPENQSEPTKVSWSNDGSPDDFYVDDLKEICESGNPDAQFELASVLFKDELYPGDLETAMKLTTDAAEQGHDGALVALSQIYFDGNEFTKQDKPKGEQCLRKAISLGSPFAMAVLADELKEGVHVEQNIDEAIQLLTASAEHGFVPAMAELGDYYEFGIGVERNLEKALELYQSALENGFEPVQPAVDRVLGQLNKQGGLFGKIGSMFSSLYGKTTEEIGVEEAVVMVQRDDPEMKAAVLQAQSSLDEFAEAIKNPMPDHSYSVKVRMEEHGEVEFIWLSNVNYDAGYFKGIVDNDPQFMEHVKLGDEHKAHANEVHDWLIVDGDGGLRGGYTVQLLQRRHAEASGE